MKNPKDLYLMDLEKIHIDLFRIGDGRPSRLFSETRAFKDCVIMNDPNGIPLVIADGNGFSTFSKITNAMRTALERPDKVIWKIRAGSRIPAGLRLVQDMTRPEDGHYFLAPVVTMPLAKYVGL